MLEHHTYTLQLSELGMQEYPVYRRFLESIAESHPIDFDGYQDNILFLDAKTLFRSRRSDQHLIIDLISEEKPIAVANILSAHIRGHPRYKFNEINTSLAQYIAQHREERS